MSALQGPNLNLNYGWIARESGWNTGLDDNLKLLDAVLQLSVISRTLATPPASPANGDRYIVPSGATGAWSGHTNQVVVRIAGAWTFYVPRTGWLCHIEDEAKLSVFRPAGWSAGIAI